MGNTEQSGFRALGALSGLLASIIFPFLMKRMSLATMGIFGIYLQVRSLLSIPPPRTLRVVHAAPCDTMMECRG